MKCGRELEQWVAVDGRPVCMYTREAARANRPSDSAFPVAGGGGGGRGSKARECLCGGDDGVYCKDQSIAAPGVTCDRRDM